MRLKLDAISATGARRRELLAHAVPSGVFGHGTRENLDERRLTGHLAQPAERFPHGCLVAVLRCDNDVDKLRRRLDRVLRAHFHEGAQERFEARGIGTATVRER